MEYPFKDLMPLDEATARDGYYKDWTHIDADTFHQISELVKFIREKGYGADTREAIAQALERVYHDATISGNANMEVSQARGSYPSLGKRLDETTAQLAEINVQKADKDEIFSMANMGQDIKEAMTGGSVAVVGENSTGTVNLIDKAVTPAKTNFVTIGKNKFHADYLVAAGKYRDYNTGELVSMAGFDYYEIPAYEHTQYAMKSGDFSIQTVFLDGNKKFISGQVVNWEGSPKYATTVGGTQFIGVSVPAHLKTSFQIELGNVSTDFESYRIGFENYYENIQHNYYAVVYIGTVDIDLVNKKIIVDNLGGVYSIADNSKREKTTEAYNIASEIVDVSAQLLSNDFLFHIIVETEEGNIGTLKFQPYSEKLLDNQYIIASYDKYENQIIGTNKERFLVNGFPHVNNIIDVTLKPSGGHFSTLKSALEYTSDAYRNKQYIIHVYEGVTDAFEGYTRDEIENASFVGPKLKDYVSIQGEGDFRKIWLKGRLDDTYSFGTQARVAPLNLSSINNVTNISMVAKNTRYVIHDDENTVGLPAKRIYRNVYLYKELGGGLPAAYGAGCLNGANYEFDNFIVSSEMGTPFSLHNLSNFTDKCVFKLNRVDCYNLLTSESSEIQYNFSIGFPSEMSNTEDEIIMTNCHIPDGVYSWADMSQSGTNTTGQIDFTIKGSGNTVAPNLIKSYDGSEHYILFNEEIKTHVTTEIVTKGNPLKYSQRGKVAPMSVSDSPNLFIGVALTSGGVGEEVAIRYKGYLHKNDTSLATLSVGDKVGVVNGQLAVVTDGGAIGTSVLKDYILMP